MSGTLETVGGRPALRFEWSLAHPVEPVWQAIIVPAELELWFPAAADWTPEAGEVFEAGGQTGTITQLQPPRLLEWTFGGQLFRFELRPGNDGCTLTFTHVFDERAAAAQTASGWECYFDRLESHLRGHYLSEERAHEPIGERHERYAARFGLDPAPGRAFIATALGFRGLTLDEGPTLRLERRYDQPVERVWRSLTDQTELHEWFSGELEAIESEPPRSLAGSWQGEGRVTFELRPQGDGCALAFTHAFTDRDQAALAAAGWDRCFARLDALFAEHPISESDALAAWLDVHDRLAAAWNIDPAIGHEVYARHENTK